MVVKANQRQVGGDHYARGAGACPHCGGRLQHWDLAAMFGWDYFQGQIIKYVMRWRDKNGKQDLEKGLHTLTKYVEVADQGDEPGPGYVDQNHRG